MLSEAHPCCVHMGVTDAASAHHVSAMATVIVYHKQCLPASLMDGTKLDGIADQVPTRSVMSYGEDACIKQLVDPEPRDVTRLPYIAKRVGQI